MKCPYCGKQKIVPIIYGYPGNDLFIKEENKEIRLGGSVSEKKKPQKYCLSCEKPFDKIHPDSLLVQKCCFFIGGYVGTSYNLEITQLKNSFNISCQKSNDRYENFIEIRNINIELSQWACIWKNILKCYVYDWNEKYVDNNIIDGTNWELHIESISELNIEENLEILNSSGENQYPVYYNKLLRIFSKLIGEKIA